MHSRSWDGAEYDKISAPMIEMAQEVAQRLCLRGDETVLDAGCGSGRVSRLLAEKLPTGMVYAVDSDASMMKEAASRLSYLDNVQLIQADLLALELPSAVDAVLSTAVFHWIRDHQQLFISLRRVMLPGGRLAAQCGGQGNIQQVLRAAAPVSGEEPFSAYFEGFVYPAYFASPGDTRARLAQAGFSEVDCWLTDRPVAPEQPERFLRSIILQPFVSRLPHALADGFVARVIERLPAPLTIDYVRLNINARA